MVGDTAVMLVKQSCVITVWDTSPEKMLFKDDSQSITGMIMIILIGILKQTTHSQK